MANVRAVQACGEQLDVIFDDGSHVLAYPTVGNLWLPNSPLIVVSPPAPTQSDNTVSVPAREGVNWSRDGYGIAPGSHTLTSGAASTFSARPTEGYTFPDGATQDWSFTWTAPPVGGLFRWPFPRNLINFQSYFGHSGIDWPGGSVGTSVGVRSISDGEVVERNGQHTPYLGNYVRVYHGNIEGINISSIYAHFASAPAVGLGNRVSGGQVLGTIGTTGESTGIHSHLEIVYNGQRLPKATPNNNTPGLGFQRTLGWMDGHASGTW